MGALLALVVLWVFYALGGLPWLLGAFLGLIVRIWDAAEKIFRK